jgi:DtxR family Mn-dependent transcriptional regulator
MKPTPLSRSVEDYLKAIYTLSVDGGTAATSAIARALDIQPASVTGMVKRLSDAELVEHLPYRGVRLSETGRKAALKVLRRHRILETYLSERLGFAWEEVHAEAERLEHAASDRLIETMANALKNPSHDPHGSPIPTAGGEIEAFTYLTLAEVPVGVRFEVKEVRDDKASRLKDMEAWGLVPGAEVTVIVREGLNGPVEVCVGEVDPRAPEETCQAVPLEVARRVYVVELEVPVPFA